MTINLVPVDDPRTKIEVHLPYRQKNGHVKDVEFFLPKMDYIDRDVMDDYRKWVRKTREERDAARKTALERIRSGKPDVELPEPLGDLETLSELCRRLVPDVWDKYLAEQANGVKIQLFSEWTEQSKVKVGESSASSTSSDAKE